MMDKTFPDGSTMNIEQMADDIRAEFRAQRKNELVAAREAELNGLTRDERIAHVVAHIRFCGSQYSPQEWYR